MLSRILQKARLLIEHTIINVICPNYYKFNCPDRKYKSANAIQGFSLNYPQKQLISLDMGN
jgi:hypothetical protein